MLLLEIGLVLIAATALGYVMRLLKQPMILGYMLAGLIIGPAVTGFISNNETITTLSELGIAFLLFIVGLELDFGRIKDTGRKAAIMGTSQVIFTSLVGYYIALWFGFPKIEALYIALALTFSSTMLAIKLMADKNTLDTVYGRLVLGMLLIQDVIAIFVLALLVNIENATPALAAVALGKGLVLFAGAFIAAKTVIPLLFNYSARSTELLFLSAVSLLFVFAYAAHFLGYSLAIGAFIAGVTLASSAYKEEVGSRVKSLRDFFATVFFVSLGMQLTVPLNSVLVSTIVFSLFVIIGNPLIVALSGRAVGYNKRISILSGLPMGQISEFSLILIALGVTLGHVSQAAAATMTAVAAVTLTISTYMIRHDDAIYRFIARSMRSTPQHVVSQKKYDVVILGYNRIGHSIVHRLKYLGKSFVVVDFDPDVIRKLRANNVNAIYGDVGDVEFIRSLNLKSAKLVISTIPHLDDSKMILRESPNTTIVTTHKVNDALALYELGATYVVVPHFIGGEHVASLLEQFTHLPTALQHKFAHITELHARKLSMQA